MQGSSELVVHGEPIAPDRYCNARTRNGGRDQQLCRHEAGWGTDHPGIGRCKLHGGATPVRHGLYSQVTAHRLADRLARFRQDEQQLLDLREQIALQAAIILEYLAGLGETGTLAAEEAKTLAGLIEAVSRNIERFHKIEQSQTFGPAEIKIVLARVVTIVRGEADRDTAARIGRRLLAQLGTDEDAA
jgi:hypothetical protein